jgi:hypothetical protein
MNPDEYREALRAALYDPKAEERRQAREISKSLEAREPLSQLLARGWSWKELFILRASWFDQSKLQSRVAASRPVLYCLWSNDPLDPFGIIYIGNSRKPVRKRILAHRHEPRLRRYYGGSSVLPLRRDELMRLDEFEQRAIAEIRPSQMDVYGKRHRIIFQGLETPGLGAHARGDSPSALSQSMHRRY